MFDLGIDHLQILINLVLDGVCLELHEPWSSIRNSANLALAENFREVTSFRLIIVTRIVNSLIIDVTSESTKRVIQRISNVLFSPPRQSHSTDR
jgi:hypothetical protein